MSRTIVNDSDKVCFAASEHRSSRVLVKQLADVTRWLHIVGETLEQYQPEYYNLMEHIVTSFSYGL